MKAWSIFIASGAVLLATSAWAQEQPRLGFKDIYLGMAEEALRAICEEPYREDIEKGYPGWKSRSVPEKKDISALEAEIKQKDAEFQRQAPTLTDAEKKDREEDIRRKLRALMRLTECYAEPILLKGKYEKAGGISLRSVTVHVKDEKVGGIRLGLSRNDFEAMEAALTERYGPPLLRTTEVVKNKLGAEFNSEVLTWEFKEGTILMKERSGYLDSSEVFIASYAFLHAAEKERKSRAKKDAGGL